MNVLSKKLAFAFIGSLLLISCGGSSETTPEDQANFVNTRSGVDEVIIHELSDPDRLNPMTSTSANATYVQYNLFQYLLEVDKKTLELRPSLAAGMPEVIELTEGPYAGGLAIKYEIHPDAKWDNGEPITARDVEFTFKCVKNPFIDAEHHRPYIRFISAMEIDPENEKQFTFYAKEPYFAASYSSGGIINIMPEYVYDANGVMRNYTLQQLHENADKDMIREDQALRSFAEQFHDEKYQREKGFVVGSGPYELKSWMTGQRIILKKKENWWGKGLEAEQVHFEAYPQTIVYEIVNDWTTAVTALKDNSIDIARNIQAKQYNDLSQNNEFQLSHHLFKPLSLSFTYIGFNMKHPIFSDKLVRQAFNHMMDKKRVIEVINYGYAEPTIGPIHPTMPYYNKEIEAYTYDMKAAKALLTEAGWTDSDGNGVLDKMVNGKKLDFKVVFKYNSGNQMREKAGLFLKDEAKKLGIEIEVVSREWTVYLDEVKQHNFDLFCLGWVQEAGLDDPTQIWHTESYNGGSNYVGFGNQESDKLIESLTREMNDEKRYDMYRELQAVIHEQAPYIFLYTPYNTLAMSKRFSNAEAYVARPGYNDRGLRVSNAQ